MINSGGPSSSFGGFHPNRWTTPPQTATLSLVPDITLVPPPEPDEWDLMTMTERRELIEEVQRAWATP